MATVYAQPIDLPVPHFPEAGEISQRVSRHNFARAQAYSTFHSSQTSPLLNITTDGKQLTYRGVMHGEDQDLWGAASGAELIKLIVERKTLVSIHKHEQPADQRKYTTYYNPQVKEKLDENGAKTQRVRGTFGGNRKCAYVLACGRHHFFQNSLELRRLRSPKLSQQHPLRHRRYH